MAFWSHWLMMVMMLMLLLPPIGKERNHRFTTTALKCIFWRNDGAFRHILVHFSCMSSQPVKGETGSSGSVAWCDEIVLI